MAAKTLLTTALAAAAWMIAAPALGAQTLTEQGDLCFALRGESGQAEAALAKYQEALAAGEDPFGAYWRMARAEYWIGDHTPDKAAKRRVFEMGIYHARKAVQLGPDRPEGHFWLGVNYGVYGEAKGILKSLSLVKPIKECMRRTEEIEPGHDMGGPDRVLGRVFYELPGFAGGSKKRSLEHLLKSLEHEPRVGLTYIYLADTYVALDEIGKAREALEHVLAMEPHPDLIPETAEEREMARKRLEGKPFKAKK
jgi:tetratricopeptide (TPR) repeat protein